MSSTDAQATAADSRSEGSFSNLVLRLESRNYRLFFAGQLVSMIGTGLTRIATGWLVYRLSNSALMLGIIGFAGQIPTLLAAPAAGVLVDRWNRHRVLVVTQVLSMLQSFALAYFALRGTITVYHILVLQIFQGLINALDMPARQAFVVEMVEKREHLSNAIALNSTLVNASRLLGPAIGGVLIAAVGEGMCFLIDGISYIAVIIALLAMTVSRAEAKEHSSPLVHEMRAGFKYALGFRPIRSVLSLMALVSLAGVPYTALLPVFAKDELHRGALTLGVLMAFSGAGALAGGIYLAARKTVVGLGKVILWSTAAFGGGLILLGAWPNVYFSSLMMLIAAGAMMLQMASCNTVLQTIVEDDMRGRVMSFFTMAFMGTVPIGTLLSGWLAQKFNVTTTMMLGGGVCVLGAAWFARELPEIRKLVRPIYVKRGIVPEVATGLQAVSALTTREE